MPPQICYNPHMPTTTTPVQDSETLVNRIIAELRADPAAQSMLLKAMLTGEFLGIPVRLDGIEETLKSIQASLTAIETRLDRLEEGQQRTEQRLDRIETRLDRTEERLDRIETRLDRTEERLDRIETRLDRTEERLDRIETTVSRIDDTVGDLSGKSYEASLATRLDTILSQRLELRRPQTIRSALDRLPPEISAQIEDAADENLISDSQRTRITQTDLIIRAQRKSDRAWIWLAIEASISIHRDDIDRARQSAQALAALFGEPAIPVAVGQRIDAPETQHAQTTAVHISIVT